MPGVRLATLPAALLPLRIHLRREDARVRGRRLRFVQTVAGPVHLLPPVMV